MISKRFACGSKAWPRWLRLLFTLVPALFCAAAHAADPCDAPQQPWACFGSIELRSGAQTIRMTIHANQELLAEIVTPTAHRRFMRLQPSGQVLYLGMSDEDLASGDKGPFMFFDYPFAHAVRALRQAFPAGPTALTAATVSKSVDVGGQAMDLSARLLDASLLSFEIKSERSGVITGQIKLVRAAALPASHAIADWRDANGKRFDTLGLAR